MITNRLGPRHTTWLVAGALGLVSVLFVSSPWLQFYMGLALVAVLLGGQWLRYPNPADLTGFFGVVIATYLVLGLQQPGYSIDLRLQAVTAAIAGAAGYRLGMLLVPPRPLPRISREELFGDATGWEVSAAVCFLLGLLLFALYLRQIGGLSQRLKIGYGGEIYNVSAGLGPLAVGYDFMKISTIAGIASRKARGRSVGVWWIPVAMIVLYAWSVGDRRTVVGLIGALAVIAFFVRKRRKVQITRVLALVGVTFVLAVMLGLARYALSRGNSASAVQYSFSHVSRQYLDPRNVNEFRGPTSSLYVLISQPTGFRHGGSYKGLVTALVPTKALGVTKLETPAETYMKIYFYKDYLAGYGHALSPVAEGFWNFGLLGSAAQLFVYAIGLRLLTNLVFARRGRAFFKVVALAASAEWILVLARIDATTATRGITARLIFPLLVLFVVHQITAGIVQRRRGASQSNPSTSDQLAPVGS